MEKLQPLIKHRFWIMLGLAVLLPLIGWWMGTSELKAHIEEREKALATAFNAPKQITSDSPNPQWTQALSVINDERELKQADASKLLWEYQKEIQSWPADVHETMSKLPYNGEPKGREADLYRSSYFRYEQKVREILDPFDPKDLSGSVSIEWGVKSPFVKRELWNNRPPTTKEMWESQEDLWLLEALFSAIRRTNGAETADMKPLPLKDAAIRQILLVSLRGGNRKEIEARNAATASTEQAPGMEMSTANPYGGSSMPMSSPSYGTSMSPLGTSSAGEFSSSGMTGTGGQQIPRIDIDMNLEFGSEQELATASGEAGAMDPSTSMPDMSSSMMTTGNQRAVRRYVDDDPTQPYRTRAFYLHVVMLDSKVTELLVNLRRSRWPVTITRVHRQDKFQATIYGQDDSQTTGGNTEEFSGTGFESSSGTFSPTLGGTAGLSKRHLDSLKQLRAAALEDERQLVHVVVTGLLWLYNPPQEGTEDNATAQNNPSVPGTQVPGQPPVTINENTPPGNSSPLNGTSGNSATQENSTAPGTATSDSTGLPSLNPPLNQNSTPNTNPNANPNSTPTPNSQRQDDPSTPSNNTTTTTPDTSPDTTPDATPNSTNSTPSQNSSTPNSTSPNP